MVHAGTGERISIIEVVRRQLHDPYVSVTQALDLALKREPEPAWMQWDRIMSLREADPPPRLPASQSPRQSRRRAKRAERVDPLHSRAHGRTLTP